MFLRHEGFLGALGAFLQDVKAQALRSAPLDGAWIEKFIKCSIPLRRTSSRRSTTHASDESIAGVAENEKRASTSTASLAEATRQIAMHVHSMSAKEEMCNSDGTTLHHSGHSDNTASTCPPTISVDNQLLGKAGLQVGVLHLVPTLKSFPLLQWPERYEPNTIDMLESSDEREYWLDILHRLSPGLVEKAVASELSLRENGNDDNDDVFERGEAFRSVFAAHLDRLREEPAAYGRIGLSGLFGDAGGVSAAFGFKDAYLDVKRQENAAALAVLLIYSLNSMHCKVEHVHSR